MKSKKSTKVADSEQLSAQIESLDAIDGNIADMSPAEMEQQVARIIKGSSQEAREIRATRKGVRYKLYRLRTDANGKASASEVVEPGFREHFEAQPLFKGWRFFAELWDVALTDPMRVVARHHGEQAEWDSVVAAKFPQLTSNGGVIYPDITVLERVQAEASKRLKAEEDPSVEEVLED